ncbi:ABC transporter ATP-binding protein [Fretibacterium fastidiosum]|uniref:Oligopeptide/dipeptide ABC transporter, ATP-binding protein, C-terminal domain n=1 Tax=Fretibacterium fastidiosum TaxID=651822 RepID=A0AB94IVM0_9BACT|nr:ABC transporter ATP-binding protein [Fretibacterium fastidiosum]CBL27789.1 oligopeptide/dipeptide ABC transporter, ATP-binding protein, C-terminal domain [Fretibacterium fastidiosum]
MDDRLLLQVKGLRTWFHTFKGVVKAVDDVSFDIRVGEVLAVVGESGGGKSVTGFSVIRLIDEPGRIESGEVLFAGRDLMKLSEREMNRVRGKDISMVFQDAMTSLNPVYTIGQQIDEVLRLHTSMGRADRRRASVELLRSVGISNPEGRLGSYPHQFSGGMRQRVVIAIALAARPRLIIADEPTTALDVTVQAQILRLMTDLIHAEGCSLMLITHDLAVVSEIADRINVMYCGRIVESGPARAVIDGSLHPYTLGLIDSIPDLNREQGRFKTIPGIVPNMFDLPRGCRFSPRCERAQDLCRTSAPDLRELEPGHCVACHFPIHREVRS